ncbi:MAG: class I SAM-dependent methyltransferase [Phycisphaerales bacterium]|nr:class I SAM-dependent methyltransferase [Phycisphaerales bacterium]
MLEDEVIPSELRIARDELATEVPEYGYASERPAHTMAYLQPVIRGLISPIKAGTRVLDLGCGNGAMCKWLAEEGCHVVGVDPSAEGIERARKRGLPNARFEVGLASPDLMAKLGEAPFDLVISTEVVEHLYAPREWAACAFSALGPGGSLVCSTPYHGYVKNVLLAVTGKLDQHFTVLWDGGHIKFWSPRTLSMLLEEAGFGQMVWRGAGRLPMVWMSMVMRGTKPRVE